MGRRIIAGIIIAASVILAVVGWLYLPDTVIIQFTLTGSGIRTAPKALGIAIPLLLGVIFGIISLINDGKDQPKYLIGGGLGVAIAVLSLIVNL